MNQTDISDREGWECPHCGATDPHHATTFPKPDDPRFEDFEYKPEPEVEVDVTCGSVYFTPVGGGPGFAFDYREFEQIIDHYHNRPEFK